MVQLTVFTPTYNRAKTLKRTYESLLRQTNKDFIWLIIDDGSTDNTRSIVSDWMNSNNSFEIQYIYKENGGLHTGYNAAIEKMQTELCVCIDSDDFMPDNAVESILNFWSENKCDEIAGIIGLDFTLDNKPIGGFFHEEGIDAHLSEISGKYGHHGDTKMVVRTKLLKQVAPQPTFNQEKNFNPIYMMLLIDYKYKFRLLNKNLCFVDYQTSGMTNNIYRQYYNSPNSFAALRQVTVHSPGTTWVYKYQQYIHYVADMILAKKIRQIFKPGMSGLGLICAFIPGVLLSQYIIFKAKS